MIASSKTRLLPGIFLVFVFLLLLAALCRQQGIPLVPLLPISFVFLVLLALVMYRLSLAAPATATLVSGSEDPYQQLVNSANSIILRWDTRGIIRFINPYGLEFFGFREDEIVGKNVMQTIVPPTETTGRDLAYMIEDIGRNPDDYIRNENENIKKDGSRVWITWNNKAVTDEQGRTVEILSIGNDITDKKHYEQKIYQLAHFDDLTGLPNRTLFRQRLEEAMQQTRRDARILPVFYLDLDRFKPINDSLGHHNGDRLLQQLASRLLACLRPNETLARMGGDEFTAILQGQEDRQDALRIAQQVARKMLDAMSQPFQLDEHPIYITGSIGIVFYPHDGEELSLLLKNADMAMYQAKQKGKNCYLFYEPHMNSQAMHNLKLETELRQALENSQLEVHYQPSLNLRTGRVECVEALLRWQHPELGNIPPETFIPIAEESDLILRLGNWVLKQAIDQAAFWSEQEIGDFIIAINLSMRQFSDEHLPERILRELQKADLPASRLGLELTESTVMQDSQRGLKTLTRLHELGVCLFIDDFGTGYSSLSRLQNLPLHMLKIDKSFVANIDEHPRHARLIDAIIAMAHNLGIKVIAEGVETQQQFDYLIQRGCDCIQGHHFCPALPAAELGKRLREIND